MRVVTLPTSSASLHLHGRRAVLPRSSARPPRAAAGNGSGVSNGNGNGSQRRQASKTFQISSLPVMITTLSFRMQLSPGAHVKLFVELADKKQGPDYLNVQRNLALELVRVTEAAALAGGKWYGRGDKNAADQVSWPSSSSPSGKSWFIMLQTKGCSFVYRLQLT